VPRSLNAWLLPQACFVGFRGLSLCINFAAIRGLTLVVPGWETEIKNEILFVMRDSRAFVSVWIIRLARNNLLRETET
jgi:hypothetical protein